MKPRSFLSQNAWVSAALLLATACTPQTSESGPEDASAVQGDALLLQGDALPLQGDAFFAANGVDSAGSQIGTDCTIAAPCQTVAKALAMLAANVALNSNRDYTFYFEDVGGPFYVASTLVYNSTHTVAPGYKTSFLAYPGQQPVISGGRDISGTWSQAAIPNGGATTGCVSNALAGSAPLDVTGPAASNAGLFVGVLWIKDQRIQEVIRPRIGQAPDYVAGTPGSPVGASVSVSPTASFMSGSPAVTISDLAKIGIVGETLAFNTTAAGFLRWRRYWIVTKSAATGAGTVTLSGTPGGAAQAANATAANVEVSDPVQSLNNGQRTNSPAGMNQFPVGPGYQSAYNQTDVKVWIAAGYGASGSLVPIATATASQVTLNSRWFQYTQMYAGVAIRRWNAFEDLGTDGYSGELWTDRKSGLIYYTPRAGETCDSLNAPGTVIVPTLPEILLKISSATADGSQAGHPVGNLLVQGFKFAHTNTSVFTGVNNLNGSVGGYIGGGDSSPVSVLDSAITLVGASYVTLDKNEVAHLGGSGIAAAWGSNHVTLTNNYIHDVGGQGVLSGMGVPYADNFHYNTDPGYYGTAVMGPSTPSWNSGGSAKNKDQSGRSDCCNQFINNRIIDAGRVDNGATCMSMAMWQEFTIDHNTLLYCPDGGLQEQSIFGASAGAPSFGGQVLIPVSYKNQVTNNEIGYVGYETSLTGAHIPGSTLGSDFGALYINSGQDGVADGSDPQGQPLHLSGNWIHDVSASCWPLADHKGRWLTAGRDGVLDYHDMNSTNGIIEENNLFTLASSVEGQTPCPTTFTQHTGNLRSIIRNNIFAGTFPAGATEPSGYHPHADTGPYDALPWRSNPYTCSQSSPCTAFHAGNVYQATASGTSGADSSSAPTCTAGVCPADGTMSWTFVQALPTNPAVGFNIGLVQTSNVTAWTVPAGSTADYPQAGWTFPWFPEFVWIDNSIYYQAGQTLTVYSHSNGLYTIMDWNALNQDLNTTYLKGWNADPNFVDMTGAQGLASWAFKTSGGAGAPCRGAGAGTYSPACSLGFVPFDFSGVGAH